jgi:hypothetical protein
MLREWLAKAAEASVDAAATTEPAAAPPRSTAPPGSRLGLGYRVPAAALSEEERARLTTTLTLTQRQSGYTRVAPEPVECAVVVGDMIDVPRFWGLERWGPADHASLADGAEMSAGAVFVGRLRDNDSRPQVAARDACLHSMRGTGLGGGMLVLPCGYGKTVVAIAIAAAHRRRTIVVVGKEFLMDQWAERIAEFVPGATVGRIRQDCVEVDGCDFVVAMLQSLSSRQYDPEVLRSFGLAVFDEAHHVAARCFNRAVRALPARCVLGCSATPDRRDGLGRLLKWSIGPELFRAVRPPEDLLVMTLRFSGGSTKLRIGSDGQPMVPTMQTALAADARRNAMLAREIAALYAVGRHVIVLSERKAQLKHLEALLLARGVDPAQIGYYIGPTSKAQRAVSATLDVILSTYCMAREALDIQRLDTLVMASPVGSMEQAVGRIQRPSDDKQMPLVVDVHDPLGPFIGLASGRSKFYDSQEAAVAYRTVTGVHHEHPVAAAWAAEAAA